MPRSYPSSREPSWLSECCLAANAWSRWPSGCASGGRAAPRRATILCTAGATPAWCSAPGGASDCGDRSRGRTGIEEETRTVSLALDHRRPTSHRASGGPAWRERLADHRPFVVAFAAGVVVRIVVTLGFTPALIQSDGPSYLALIHHLSPDPNRPGGYVLGFLEPLSWISDNAALCVAVQHVVGLLTGVLVYDLVRRWGSGRWWGMVAALPLLL